MRRVLLLLALLAFVGAASATDYYVATWGDNTTQGDITHPWQNVSYATQQAVAGDTIYLFNGTWYNETCTFANSGNATHPITITAYNGTPELDGQDTTFTDQTNLGLDLGGNNYINIDGLEIHNYYCTIGYLDSHCMISNCILHDTGGTLPSGQTGGVAIGLSVHNSTHNIIENCTLYNSGWNTIQVSGNREPPSGNGDPATYITVRNCTIYNSTKHNAIDLFGNLQHVIIEDNELYDDPAGGIFDHDEPDHRENVTIRDNYFHDTQEDAIQIGSDSYCEIYNNTFKNITGNFYPMYIYVNSHDFEIYNNSFYNCTGPRTIGGYNFVFDRNYIHADSGAYLFSYGTNNTVVRNPLGKQELGVKYDNATAELEFDDGALFIAQFGAGGNPPSSYTPVRYYLNKSNCSITSTEDGFCTLTPTTYNITLSPTYAYLCNVTVNHESSVTDDRTNISVNSTVATNPTWINAAMQNSSNTYNVSIDGVYTTQTTSDADGIVRYQYSSSWSPHTFEFDWLSDAGFSGAPDPTNLANITGVTWVNHTWQAGSGNITDSYNVSINTVWHNSTTNTYYNDTGLSAESWSNITIWAFNNTGGISQNSINQNIQSNAAAWAPSNTAMYYNVSSMIEITTKIDGTNIFSRTPTEMDGNATSFKLVVKTT